MITIKKYPNRRLYDTSKSCYINLETVKAMVKQGIPFQVLDSKSGENISRQILLQIIGEYETQPQYAMLSRELLQELIRQYGAPGQMEMHSLLERGLKDFLDLMPVGGSATFEKLLSDAYAGAESLSAEQVAGGSAVDTAEVDDQPM